MKEFNWNNYCMWYSKLVEIWNEVLLIGNGWFGVMIFGGVVEE